MATDEIFVDNDSLVFLNGFVDKDGGFINDGTVVATLFDSTGLVVITGGEEFSLSYVAASDGIYEGVLDKAVSIVEGVNYRLKVAGTSGSGDYVEWNDVVARRRIA